MCSRKIFALSLVLTACSKRDGFRANSEVVLGQWDARENRVLEVGASTPVELAFFNGTGADCAPMPEGAIATIDGATLSMIAVGGAATEAYKNRPRQYKETKGKECRPAVFRLVGPRPKGNDIQISLPGYGAVSCTFDGVYAPRTLTVSPAGPLKEGDAVTVTAVPPSDIRIPNQDRSPLTLESKACATKIQGDDLKVESTTPDHYVFKLPKICAGRAQISFNGSIETRPISSTGTKCRVQRYRLDAANIDIAN